MNHRDKNVCHSPFTFAIWVSRFPVRKYGQSGFTKIFCHPLSRFPMKKYCQSRFLKTLYSPPFILWKWNKKRNLFSYSYLHKTIGLFNTVYAIHIRIMQYSPVAVMMTNLILFHIHYSFKTDRRIDPKKNKIFIIINFSETKFLSCSFN